MRSRSVLATVALGIALLGGCGSGGGAQAATPETGRFAAVNAAHLCAVQETTFRTEQEIGDRLRELLAEEGLEYEDWRTWRDSLPNAPERAAQLAEVTASGC